MSCAQIQAEMAANNQLISDLGSEKGAKVAQNVIVGLAGVVIPVLWFGMDFKGAASTDQEALKQRNNYLAVMAASGHCNSEQSVVAGAPQLSSGSPSAAYAPVAQSLTTSQPSLMVQQPNTLSPVTPTLPQSTYATVSPPNGPSPISITATQPVDSANYPVSSSSAAPPQSAVGAKPPPIYTFTHASDAANDGQSSDFNNMLDSIADHQKSGTGVY